jgi:hypothetical protein
MQEIFELCKFFVKKNAHLSDEHSIKYHNLKDYLYLNSRE